MANIVAPAILLIAGFALRESGDEDNRSIANTLVALSVINLVDRLLEKGSKDTPFVAATVTRPTVR